MSFNSLIIALKGGRGSGNFGHSGIPGKVGGSISKGTNAMYGPYSKESVDNALSWLERATLSSQGMGNSNSLSAESKRFLQETVEGDPKLYRGIGLIRQRVTPSNQVIANKLQPGDNIPNFLLRQTSDISSYTKKKSVANYYSEGALRIVAEAKDSSKILADLENLPKVLSKYNVKHNFTEDSMDYWKQDKEVFVLEPIEATVVSIKGKL